MKITTKNKKDFLNLYYNFQKGTVDLCTLDSDTLSKMSLFAIEDLKLYKTYINNKISHLLLNIVNTKNKLNT